MLCISGLAYIWDRDTRSGPSPRSSRSHHRRDRRTCLPEYAGGPVEKCRAIAVVADGCVPLRSVQNGWFYVLKAAKDLPPLRRPVNSQCRESRAPGVLYRSISIAQSGLDVACATRLERPWAIPASDGMIRETMASRDCRSETVRTPGGTGGSRQSEVRRWNKCAGDRGCGTCEALASADPSAPVANPEEYSSSLRVGFPSSPP